jgi:hypothetical protein
MSLTQLAAPHQGQQARLLGIRLEMLPRPADAGLQHPALSSGGCPGAHGLSLPHLMSVLRHPECCAGVALHAVMGSLYIHGPAWLCMIGHGQVSASQGSM